MPLTGDWSIFSMRAFGNSPSAEKMVAKFGIASASRSQYQISFPSLPLKESYRILSSMGGMAFRPTNRADIYGLAGSLYQILVI